MKRIETQKEVLALLREIGTEEPLICVDEMDLRSMFENKCPIIQYRVNESKVAPQKWFTLCLRWFTRVMGKNPSAVYFKLVTNGKTNIEELERLYKLVMNWKEGMQCVFAYDQAEEIPEKCYQLHIVLG